jgi:hypothetical protein
MEDLIQDFIRIDNQPGYDDGGRSYGFDEGNGCGRGLGDGCGFSSKDGFGCGRNFGSGSRTGCNYLYDSGSDRGDGRGSGHFLEYEYGCSCNLKTFNGRKVHIIDGIQTIISQVRGNTAKGYIVQGDLILRECYVVKHNNLFAHGNTLHDAYQALQEKLYDTSTEEERISAFKEKFQDFDMKYPAKDLFSWHHILTGSCKAGREAFCRDHEIDVENDSFTIHEFIRLTRDSYNGEIIQKLLD